MHLHSMEKLSILRILASSVHLADKAGQLVRTILASKNLEIVDKGVNDLQSKADRDAQRCIVGSLNKTFPGLTIIGEEGTLDYSNVPVYSAFDQHVLDHQCPQSYSSVPLSDIVIWVDPLDGTKEFTEGLIGHVTILIGIAVRGKPVAGVITQPFYHPESSSERSPSPSQTITRTIWALDGLGIFGMQPKLPFTAGQPLPYPINPDAAQGAARHTVVVTRSHPSDNLSAAIDACAPTEVIRAGGCGFKVLLLLDGTAHVYLFPSAGTKRWDTCAPEAVLRAAGGRLTDMRGHEYDYSASSKPGNSAGVLATAVADWLPIYEKRMPQTVLASLAPS